VGHDPDVADALERDGCLRGGQSFCSPYQR
jgi:hypothetical protein